jgi:integrase
MVVCSNHTGGIETWLSARPQEGNLSRRSLQKIVVLLNGIFKRARKVWKLTHDPMVDVERLTVPKRTDIEFYSTEEVHALVRAAADEQDAALFLTGALTGLRMGELLALRWRDIDFPAQTLRVTASYTNGKLGTPKSAGAAQASLRRCRLSSYGSCSFGRCVRDRTDIGARGRETSTAC